MLDTLFEMYSELLENHPILTVKECWDWFTAELGFNAINEDEWIDFTDYLLATGYLKED